MPVGNFLVGGVLRSPLHRVMSRSLMLLTFQGARTGKDYTIPVAYARFGPDELIVLAGRPDGRTWWTDRRGGLPVRLHLEGRELAGDAQRIEGEEATSRLDAYLERLPRTARSLGLAPGANGRYARESLDALAAKVPVVSVKLRPGSGRPR
jgi:hypothetical protein